MSEGQEIIDCRATIEYNMRSLRESAAFNIAKMAKSLDTDTTLELETKVRAVVNKYREEKQAKAGNHKEW